MTNEGIGHAGRQAEAARRRRQHPQVDPDVPLEAFIGDPEAIDGAAGIQPAAKLEQLARRFGPGEADAELFLSHTPPLARPVPTPYPRLSTIDSRLTTRPRCW